MRLTWPILKRTVLLLLFLASCVISFAQQTQSEFLEAKRLFREEQYTAARSAFASLNDDPTFGNYATFYTGLAAYRLNDPEPAVSIWKLIIANAPSWDQLPDVYFWLTKTHLERSQFAEGLRYARDYQDRFSNNLNELRNRYLPQANREQLKTLIEEFPDDRLVVTELAKKLDRTSQEDVALLKELIGKYELDVEEYSEVANAEVRRESYSIAAMLPFMFDGLDSPTRTVANKVIMDFYQGMLLAQKDLDSVGYPVDLYPYDTQRDSAITKSLLLNPSLKDSDLIIGPFLPGPIDAVKPFSVEHQINMVNPVSSNQKVVNGNDFAYLLKAGYPTIGEKLAERAQLRFEGNNRALVYFSANERDSIVALNYKETIEAAGFEVLDYRSIDNETSRPILDSLIEQHEEFIATMEEVDSLMEIPGRFIKNRKIDPESELELEYLIISEEEETEGDSLVFYEMKFNVVEDSIGHIMVSSRDNGIVNNFISAIESRPDSIGLLGYGNWINFKVIDYEQFERLGVELAYPEFIDKRGEAYKELYQRSIDTYASIPSDFVFFGYECLWYLGTMLHKHGKYFQNGFLQEGYSPGTILSGYEFGINNDNQIVPIITFKNSRLIPVQNSDGSFE
jgi:tetratricopeptide (TPR) repeat protein